MRRTAGRIWTCVTGITRRGRVSGGRCILRCRAELLDRLLELNHERYAAEVAAGLHDKKGGKKPPKRSLPPDGEEPTLFGDDA